jgi:hypothetical protein
MAKTKTPAQRYLRYVATNSETPGTEVSRFIDLARDLSRVNRRLMQQGRMYHIKRITVVSSNTLGGVGWIDYNGVPGGATLLQQNPGRISFSTIPETWVSQQAWQRGKTLWNKANKEAQAGVGNVAGTWSDFKIYMSNDHRTGTVLTPVDNGGNAYSGGDWEYSVLVSPDGTTAADPFYLQMLGNHNGSAGAWNAVGLIKSYGESRATVNTNEPNVPSTADNDPLANMFDDGTVIDERIANLRIENDAPPYSVLDYPGDDTNGPKPAVVVHTTLGVDGKATLPGFSAMCGLIEIEMTSPIGNDNYDILIELKEGPYKGIAAEAI